MKAVKLNPIPPKQSASTSPDSKDCAKGSVEVSGARAPRPPERQKSSVPHGNPRVGHLEPMHCLTDAKVFAKR